MSEREKYVACWFVFSSLDTNPTPTPDQLMAWFGYATQSPSVTARLDQELDADYAEYERQYGDD